MVAQRKAHFSLLNILCRASTNKNIRSPSTPIRSMTTNIVVALEMCSTCDCDQDPRAADLGAQDSKVRGCRRCGSEAFIVLDRIHVECRSCFLESCNKKLRSTIGKSKLLTNNDPVLIAYSGNASSTALLDLIKNSIEFNFRREQKFRPSILHVDMQSICDPDQEASQRLSKLDTFLSATKSNYPKWPIYWTTIEMIAQENNCDTNSPICLKYEDHLSETPSVGDLLDSQAALNCLRTALLNLDLTDKQHYLRKSTIDLIARAASSINKSINYSDQFSCIFTASSATQLANNLLVDVILGEGSTCHSTVSICDSRWATPIVRPMKEFSKKEIAFYLRARQLAHAPQINPTTLSESRASIQKLTESFLSKLSADYPSTYSTLLRTGNKLQDS